VPETASVCSDDVSMATEEDVREAPEGESVQVLLLKAMQSSNTLFLLFATPTLPVACRSLSVSGPPTTQSATRVSALKSFSCVRNTGRSLVTP
jgi:hypothetical protein